MEVYYVLKHLVSEYIRLLLVYTRLYNVVFH